MQLEEGIVSETQQPEEEDKAHTPEEATVMLRYIIDHMAMKEDTATKDDIAELRSEMSGMVTKEGLKDELGKIRSEMAGLVTKEDLKKSLGELRYELKDHTSREIEKMRDYVHAANEKTNDFVRVVEKTGTISHKEASRLTAINPFASPVITL